MAISYATRHPGHPARLILVSTEAAALTHLNRRIDLFAKLGGPEIGELARRRFIEGDTSPEILGRWIREALPVYTRADDGSAWINRAVRTPEVTEWFTRADGGEGRSFDFLDELAAVTAPTLVIGGEADPMVPIECQYDIVQAMRTGVAHLVSIPNAGHGVVRDSPDLAFDAIRRFLTEDFSGVADHPESA